MFQFEKAALHSMLPSKNKQQMAKLEKLRGYPCFPYEFCLLSQFCIAITGHTRGTAAYGQGGYGEIKGNLLFLCEDHKVAVQPAAACSLTSGCWRKDVAGSDTELLEAEAG